MKKSSIAMISVMGTMGGLLLAIGMCMCLLPEWNAFTPGVVLAVLGAVVLLAIWPVSRKASGKGAPHITGGAVVSALLGLAGAVALGIGLVNCLQTVTTFGLAVGIVGLVLLLAAILVGRRVAGKAPIPLPRQDGAGLCHRHRRGAGAGRGHVPDHGVGRRLSDSRYPRGLLGPAGVRAQHGAAPGQARVTRSSALKNGRRKRLSSSAARFSTQEGWGRRVGRPFALS